MSKVQVFIRARPVVDPKSLITVKSGKTFSEDILSISTNDPDEPLREFMFDKFFGARATQQDLTDHICEPVVENVFSGYHACIFAYGQTTSGKTHTIFGRDGNPTGEDRGMLPRTLERIFRRIEGPPSRHHQSHSQSGGRSGRSRGSAQGGIGVGVGGGGGVGRGGSFSFFGSFYEIYLGQIKDLGRFYYSRYYQRRARRREREEQNRNAVGVLRGSASAEQIDRLSLNLSAENLDAGGGGGGVGGDEDDDDDIVLDQDLQPPLKIREKENGEVYIKNLSLVPVHSLEECIQLIKMGLTQRSTYETRLNRVSSRSHTIFALSVVNEELEVYGTLTFVDLAGSERFDRVFGDLPPRGSSGRKTYRDQRDRDRDDIGGGMGRSPSQNSVSASSILSRTSWMSVDSPRRHRLEAAQAAAGGGSFTGLSLPPLNLSDSPLAQSTSSTSTTSSSGSSPSPSTSARGERIRRSGSFISRKRRLKKQENQFEEVQDEKDRDLRVREHKDINTSLSALERVILALHSGKAAHVSYRDSPLTRVLQNALGSANCLTYVVATLNPKYYHECLKTLKFGNRCKNVRNFPTVNSIDVTSQQKDQVIQKLEKDVLDLKRDLLELTQSSRREKRDLNERIATLMSEKRNLTVLGAGSSGGIGGGGAGAGRHSASLDGSPRRPPPGGGGSRRVTRFMSESELIKGHEREQKRYEKKIAFLREQGAQIKSKAKRRKMQMEQLRRRNVTTDEASKAKINALVRKINEMKRTMGEMKLRMTMMERAKEDEIEARVTTIRDSYEEKIEEYRTYLKTFPAVLRSLTEDRKKDAATQSQIAGRYKQQYERLMQKNMQERLDQVAKKERMYEALLKTKELELLQLKTSHHNVVKKKDAQMDSLQKEIDTLYEFSTKLSAVIHKMETGVYPVHARFNMKHIKVSPEDLQFIGRWDLLNHVRTKLASLNEFIHHAEVYTAPELRSHLEGDPSSTFVKKVANELPGSSALSSFRKSRRRTCRRQVGLRRRGQKRRPISSIPQMEGSLSSIRSGRSLPSSFVTSDTELDDPLRWKELYLTEREQLHQLRIAHTSLKVELDRYRQSQFSEMSQSMRTPGGTRSSRLSAVTRTRKLGRGSTGRSPGFDRMEKFARSYVSEEGV